MSSARAVVFDAVGTLIFPTPGAPAVYAALAAEHGIDLGEDEVRRRMIAAYGTEEEVDRVAEWVTSEDREIERWRRIVSATLPEVPDAGRSFHMLFEHFGRPAAWEVNRDATTVFAGLTARGIPVGLASNYDVRLLRVLAGKPELEPVSRRVVISSQIGHRKPSPDFFYVIAQGFAAEPGQVVYVGDDYGNDYLGAGAAGLTPVLLDKVGRYPSAVRVSRLLELLDD